jgi:tetratricopeptide (TPR) repeat protein
MHSSGSRPSVRLVVLFAALGSLAAMQRGPTPRTAASAGPYAEAASAAKAGDCAKALPLLERAVARDRRDADALNLLAYCQRKTGKLDAAFKNYRRALEIRPEFPAAREYLGEAHVQAALRELEILRGYGEPAQAEIEALVKALRDAADAAEKGAAAADGGGW